MNRSSGYKFTIRIVLPAVLAIALFLLSVLWFVIPAYEQNVMERKREMIRELTLTVTSILTKFNNDVKDSLLTKQVAQQQAISEISNLRYGDELKDYFWITDMTPVMIAHPYRSDLNGKNLSGFKDYEGKLLFVEMVEKVKQSGEGFVDYMWQWKDDSTRIVPKLSYVKGFHPWGWIVGTGIYIEDVKAEIRSLEKNIYLISLAILFLITILIFFIVRQSLRIENQRRKAESDLKKSKERYKALVEASTEGAIMIQENGMYANKTMLSILGYNEEEFHSFDIFSILKENIQFNSVTDFSSLINQLDVPVQMEACLTHRNGGLIDTLLSISKIILVDKKAVIISVKDISRNKRIEKELDSNKLRFENLAGLLGIGIFRTTFGNQIRFIETNEAAMKIFGFDSREQMQESDINELFSEKTERREFFRTLLKEGFVRNNILKIKRKDSKVIFVSLSVSILENPVDSTKFCECIIQDVTEQKQRESLKDKLIEEYNVSEIFLNKPIINLNKKAVFCDYNTSVNRVAQLMKNNTCAAIIITSAEHVPIGIVTDSDIITRVVSSNIKLDSPVYTIMTSPLVSITDNALLFEALLLMSAEKVNYLAIKDQSGKISGVLSENDFLSVYKHSSAYMVSEIQHAENIETLILIQKKLQQVIISLVNSGLNPENITRIISVISDAMINKLVQMAIDETGAAPCKFAFITLGSVGRGEQTLSTDQDNAIIFEDSNSELEAICQKYFLDVSEKISNWLNEIGYYFCKGNVMAKNPRWCQPLSVWKKYFSGWINTSEPQDLLDASIFFDFRHNFGDGKLTTELRKHLSEALKEKEMFFFHLAKNVLSFKPQLSFFGNIKVQASDDAFDIKKTIIPLVGLARLYSIKHNVFETNTYLRLRKLMKINILSEAEYDELIRAYDFLMQLRFKNQIIQLETGKNPDNLINPKSLNDLDVSILKKIFSVINNYQVKVNYDFRGAIN